MSIVIAHRPETIDFADRVILITPEACIEQDGAFRPGRKDTLSSEPALFSESEISAPVGKQIIPDF